MAARSKKSELEAAQQTVRFFETVLRASADGIVITDAAQNIVVVNEAFCGIFGRRWQDVAETSLQIWLEQLDRDAPKRWTDLELRVHNEGLCSDVEFCLPTQDEVRYLSVSASLLERVGDEEVGVLISVWRDITERKRSEEELSRHRDHLEELVEQRTRELATINERLQGELRERKQAEEALAEKTHHLGERVKELGCLYGLAELLQREGISLEEVYRETVDLIPPSWQYPEDTCARLLMDGEEYRAEDFVETRWKLQSDIVVSGRKAGSIEVYYLEERPEASEGPFLEEERALLNALAQRLGRVIEHRHAEEALRELTRTLERRVEERTSELHAANEELKAFTYSVSHDLRGPVRAIDGFARLILDEHADQLDQEGARLLNVVRENTGLMGTLIEDLLELSRIGRQALEPRQVNMKGLVKEVIQELERQAPDSRREVTLGPLPSAWGDYTLIRQVWINLLANAFKFSGSGDPGVIEIQSSVKGEEIVYSVKDNGVGFDMDHAGKLFKVFERLHGREEFEGTGVGLSIVKRIVERHGGRVWAEGKVEEGATFWFTLPMSEGVL